MEMKTNNNEHVKQFEEQKFIYYANMYKEHLSTAEINEIETRKLIEYLKEAF